MKLLWLLVVIVLMMAIALTMKLGGTFEPVLEVDKQSISFGEFSPNFGISDVQSFEVRNAGLGTLNCKITTDQPWLQIDENTFDLKMHRNTNIQVAVDFQRLTKGTKDKGTITIKTNGGSATIPVDVLVPHQIITDDFANSNSGWYTGSDATSELKYQFNGYRISQRGVFTSHGKNVKLGKFGDFTYEVQATWLGSAVNNSNDYGITFREIDNYNFYYFRIQPAMKLFALSKLEDSSWSDLLPLRSWASINSDISATNHLKVVCSGPHISMIINGSDIGVNDTSYRTGYVGMGVTNHSDSTDYADAWFDNVKIIVP
jgi:hypothetical protein